MQATMNVKETAESAFTKEEQARKELAKKSAANAPKLSEEGKGTGAATPTLAVLSTCHRKPREAF